MTHPVIRVFVNTAARYRLLEPFLTSLPKPCALFAVCDTLALDVLAIAGRCGWRSTTAYRAYFEQRTGMTLQTWRAKRTEKPIA